MSYMVKIKTRPKEFVPSKPDFNYTNYSNDNNNNNHNCRSSICAAGVWLEKVASHRDILSTILMSTIQFNRFCCFVIGLLFSIAGGSGEQLCTVWYDYITTVYDDSGVALAASTRPKLESLVRILFLSAACECHCIMGQERERDQCANEIIAC